MRNFLFGVTILGLLAATRSSYGTQDGITGHWEWQGEAAWQRLALDLHENQGKVTGTIVMGPGPGNSVKREDFWEYFFDPAEFEIANGVIQGNAVSFEQPVLTNVEHNDLVDNVWNKPMKFKYTGKIEGSRLLLTRELHEKWPYLLDSRNQSFEITLNRIGASSDNPALNSSVFTPKLLEAPSLVDVSVKDGSGATIASLKPQDFEVYQNGQRRDIQTMVQPGDPWNVEFMFDTDAWLFSPIAISGVPSLAASGVRGAKDRWQQIGETVTAFYKALRPQDRLAIDLFDIRPVTLLNWKNGGRQGALVGTGGIQPPTGYGAEPEKDVYGAVSRMLERLRDATGRKVAILLTDGRDGRLRPTRFVNKSELSVTDPFFGLVNRAEEKEFEQTLDNVQKSGVRFYVVSVNANRPVYDLFSMSNGPGASQALAAHSQLLDARLSRLAEVSGGAILYRGDDKGAISLFGEIARLLGIGQTYSIQYARGIGPNLGSVEVKVRDPRLRAEVVHP